MALHSYQAYRNLPFLRYMPQIKDIFLLENLLLLQKHNYYIEILQFLISIVIPFAIFNIRPRTPFMLKRSLRTIVFGFTTPPPPRLVKINVEMKGKHFTFQFPENTKLAPNLERVRVPLDFECGFSCSCGTCCLSLNEQDFQKLQKEQPILPAQEKILNQNNFEMTVRLSCQLTVKPSFENYKFMIDV